MAADRLQVVASLLGQGSNEPAVASRVDWLVELSERARAQGRTKWADRLLLLAWRAYDRQGA